MATQEQECTYSKVRILVSVAGVLALALIVLQVLNAPDQDWNARRLVGPIALSRHIPIYNGPENGPVISGLNGPVAALVFLPAAFGSGPTSAMLLGSFIACLFFFLPMAWLHLQNLKAVPRNRRQSVVAAFVCFCFFSIYFGSLKLSAFLIHADAPALGIAAVACFFAWLVVDTEQEWPIFLSALLAVLSLYAKVTLLPFFLAVTLYLFLGCGWRVAGRYLIYFVGIGIASFVGFGAWFGFPQIFWAEFSNVFASPWNSSLSNPSAPLATGFAAHVKILCAVAFSLLRDYYFFPVLILFNFLLQFTKLAESSEKILTSLRELVRKNRSSLLALAAIFLLPASLAGRAKTGGAENTLSPTVYFMVAALTLILVENIERSGWFRRGSEIFVSLLVFVLMVASLPGLYEGTWGLHALRDNPSEQAYRYAKAHPGVTYFPDFPLSNLLADGKVYHSATLVGEMGIGTYPVTQERFRSFIPPNLKTVAFDSKGIHPVMSFLPELKIGSEDKMLPGWEIYEKRD